MNSALNDICYDPRNYSKDEKHTGTWRVFMNTYTSSLAPSMAFLISVSGLREQRNVFHQSQSLLFKDNTVILMLWFLRISIFFHKVRHKKGNLILKHVISERIIFSKVRFNLTFSIIYQTNITMNITNTYVDCNLNSTIQSEMCRDQWVLHTDRIVPSIVPYS